MNRNEVARELALKGGQDFNQLDPGMQNAYLHNADCAIAEREAPVVKEGEAPAPAFTCMVCKDEGWLGQKPCHECNPVGLRKTDRVVADENPVGLSGGETASITIEIDGAELAEKVGAGIVEGMRSRPALPIEEVESVTTTGAGLADPPTGGGDTGKSEQPPKPKAKRKAPKKPR